MTSICICDDNEYHLSFVKDLVIEYFEQNKLQFTLDSYSNGKDIITMDKPYDIYILDIVMPQISGIQIGESIRKNNKECEIIYTTTSEDYALKAFNVDAAGYLIKPFLKERFFEVFGKVLTKLNSSKNKNIYIQTLSGLTKINLNKTEYIEHINRVLYFHLSDGTIIQSSNSSITLSDLYKGIAADQSFLCPHRSFVVNLKYVHAINSSNLIMKNKVLIPISRLKSKEIKNDYMNYLLLHRR